MASIENQETRTMKDSVLIKRTWKYIKPYFGRFVLSLLLMAIMVVLQVAGPIFVDKILTLFESDIPYEYMSVLVVSLSYFACIIGSLLFTYLNTMLLMKTGQRIVYNLRQDVFEHIESLSIAQLNALPTGKFVTRVTSDCNAVNDLYTNTLVNLIKNIITAIVIAVIMAIYDWRIALAIYCFIPFIFVAALIFRKYSRRAYRNVRNCISNINAFLNENLSGMKITQIFNQEQRKADEFDVCNNQLRKARDKEVFVFAFFRPTMFTFYILAETLVFYLGFKRVGYYAEGESLFLSYTTVYLLYQYVSQFFQPIQSLADQFNSLQKSFAASERLFILMDTKPDLVDEEDAIELTEVKGKIEFKNVWFAYKEPEWILQDVSFVVEPRQTVAFVGATGAGKTTILSLIVRNYEIQKGQILIDDIDIKHIKIKSLRKAIGQMLQDVFLFSGTIRSNISLRDENISLDEIKSASEYVGANTFIEKLDKGYDYEIQERGSNFSSGQRQLISFARTIVHKPQIMILDEATSNIDTETEKLIQSSLEKMMNIGTMLIVAHRLSTIQHADNIIVLQKGKIIEQGNHQELLKQKGYYYNLYRLQFEDQEE